MSDETMIWLLYQELDRQLREAAQSRRTHPVRVRPAANKGQGAAPGAAETQRRDGVDD